MAWQEFVFVESCPCAARHWAFLFEQSRFAFGDFAHETLKDEKASVAPYAAAV